jgi:maleylacetoacetate isomerase
MLKLYSFWRSSASYRVRIALKLKHQPYEFIPVSLTQDGGQQLKPEYLAINPQGRVPYLVDGDFGLGQSLAILDYLEHRFPQPALVPAGAKLRARMLAFCHTIAADIQPLQNTGPVRVLGEMFGADDERKAAWNRLWIQRGLEALERERAALPETPFAFGDALTWADCVLVPQVYNADRWGCDVSRIPKLYALAERLRKLPEFAASHPDRQPDAPRQ